MRASVEAVVPLEVADVVRLMSSATLEVLKVVKPNLIEVVDASRDAEGRRSWTEVVQEQRRVERVRIEELDPPVAGRVPRMRLTGRQTTLEQVTTCEACAGGTRVRVAVEGGFNRGHRALTLLSPLATSMWRKEALRVFGRIPEAHAVASRAAEPDGD